MKKFGLIGKPLAHSLSPYIHERIMDEAGIKGVYHLYELEREGLSKSVELLMKDLDGFNCTIPYKEEIITSLDGMDEIAQRYRSVNTIFNRRGFNTDSFGFLAAAPDMTNKHVLILGAGGVSRTIAYEALQQGAEICICARNHKKREILVDELFEYQKAINGTEPKVADVENEEELTGQNFDVILNGTPLGMWPNVGEVPTSENLYSENQKLFDTIYNPASTKWLLRARKSRVKGQSGLKMLLLQAVKAQQIWNPDIHFEEKKMLSILPELSGKLLSLFPVKYVFTGFMGAGKTAVTKRLSQRMNIPFYDLDVEIVRARGCSIPEIFERDGEAGFRKTEALVLDELLQRKGSALIALGGGAILQESVRGIVDKNQALIVYLQASLKCIWERISHSRNRPMIGGTSDSEHERFTKAAGLYEARLPIYEKYCDAIVNAENNLESVVDETMRVLGH